MRKFQGLAFILFSAVAFKANAQTNFVFSCAKDDTATCTSNCITVRAKVPDVHAQTTEYIVNPSSASSCYIPAVAPDAPGNPTSLTMMISILHLLISLFHSDFMMIQLLILNYW